MSFVIEGLDPREFEALIGLDDTALAQKGAVRRVADARPGYPCRVTLEDAEPGENVILVNHESHSAPTPYRSSYAIYVREGARERARFVNEVPPVMRGRPIALRHFDKDGMLRGASLALKDDVRLAIEAAFGDPETAYLHAHNAAHGCFAARIGRA